MKRRYIITGAAGHLGSALLRRLAGSAAEIYALILPGERREKMEGVHYVEGDVRDIDSLRPLFACPQRRELCVIHAAGIIQICKEASPAMKEVNISGTDHILQLCREYRVRRLVYVSSVHAIREKPRDEVMRETEEFVPGAVVGAYAQTKAEATRRVLAAGKEGLDVVVVHPSGILGPYDSHSNHLVQMIRDYLRGALPACVEGGYDFVDVRDVAEGCLLAMDRGRSGGCYILSGRHYEIREVLEMARQESHGRRLAVLPMWMARAAAPAMEWYARQKKERPLYTAYSLYTLQSNGRFCHDKATRELGYMPRDLRETVRDTVAWCREGRLAPAR